MLLVLLALLLLLFQLLLALLFLLRVERLLLLLGRRFLLPRLDFRLVNLGLPLLLGVARRLVLAIACILCAARPGFVELLLVVGLLLLVRGLVRRALRRLGVTLCCREFVLTLLLGKRRLVRLLVGCALRRVGLRIARA